MTAEAVESKRWSVGATVVVVALGLVLLADWQSLSNGLGLRYPDASMHLQIARRLLDARNLTPAQLGTVWLPVPHIMLAPFARVDFLWHNEAAGAVLGSLCYVLSCWGMYKLVRNLHGSELAGVIAAAVFGLNPAMLYLSTTSLTEPVLYAAIIIAVKSLAKWANCPRRYTAGELAVFCGIPAALATMSRYDGWVTTAVSALVIIIVSQARWKSWQATAKATFGFLAIPVACVGGWLIYNARYFGDPLAFARGEFSARSQQAGLERLGLLSTHGSLNRSLEVYFTAVKDNLGLAMILAGVISIIAIVWRYRLRTQTLILLVLLAPGGFYVLSLMLGQIQVLIGDGQPPGLYNIRYGAVVVPAVALAIGLAVDAVSGRGISAPLSLNGYPLRHLKAPRILMRPAVAGLIVVALLGGVTATWVHDWRSKVWVVQEGDYLAAGDAHRQAAAEWISEHYQGGLVLVDDEANPVLAQLGLDMTQSVSLSAGPLWDESIKNPSKHVEWVLLDRSSGIDRVRKAFVRNEQFAADYRQVATFGAVEVYQRKAGTQCATANEGTPCSV